MCNERDETLRYDKGENRRKHCGSKDIAEVVWGDGGLRVGKCPKTMTIQTAERLIQCGIKEYRPTLPDRPCAIWNVYEGVIYTSRTSDGGTTWHGFPFEGDVPLKIKKALRARAIEEGYKQEFKNWLKKYC